MRLHILHDVLRIGLNCHTTISYSQCMDMQKATAKVADIDNRALEQLLLDILNAL